MSFPILTTTQYDATKYTPMGTVIINRVEALSMMRSAFAGFTGAFGGQNSLIQTAIDNLQNSGLQDFTSKVQSTYPNTAMVVSLHTDISEVGRSAGDTTSYMVMTMSGTCLAPIGQAGGARRRKTMNRRK
jgi:uncharacterized protein YbjQ (UPF0145 family)